MKKGKILIALLIFSGILLFLSLIKFKNPLDNTPGIEDNCFVMAIAIDKGIEDKENVRITISSEKFSGDEGSNSSSSSNSSKTPDVISCEGKTIFEAIRKFSTFYNKKLFLGHTKCLLIGEDIAKEDLLNYLDFYARDHEIRFNYTISVVKGNTGEAVLRLGDKNKDYILDTLQGIFKNTERLSVSKNIKLKDALQMFNNKYIATYVPSIKIISKKDAEKKETIEIVVDGFAVFNGTKLNGFISDNTSRGLNWINGNVQSTIVVIKDKDDSNVSLEVLNSKSEIEVELNDNIPKANITLEVSSNFVEQMSQKFSYSTEDINFLLEAQNDKIKNEIESALKYLQKNGLDAIGISDKIYHKYPLKWDDIKENWQELFKNMDINVTVKSKINRTYHIEEVIRNERGDK